MSKKVFVIGLIFTFLLGVTLAIIELLGNGNSFLVILFCLIPGVFVATDSTIKFARKIKKLKETDKKTL